MTDRFTLWKLAVIREVVALTAARVSLSFIWWSKPPGNHYTTFYPTSWLPPRDDRAAWSDAKLGWGLFDRAMAARRLTLASYGDNALQVPWLEAEERAFALDLSPDADPDPLRAARRAVASLNLDWLASVGDVDPVTTHTVLAWLDEVLAKAKRPEVAHVRMEFEFNRQPQALCLLELASVQERATAEGGETRAVEEVGWLERERSRAP